MNKTQHTGFVDASHQYIYPESHLHVNAHWWGINEIPPRLSRSYLWRVVDYSPECLTLVAVGGPDEEIHINHEECRWVRIYEPSWMLKLSDHPEEWAWWQAAGWNIYVTDEVGESGEVNAEYFEEDVAGAQPPHVYLHAERRERGKGNCFGGGGSNLEGISTHQGAQRFLRELLYLRLHPKKTDKYVTSRHPQQYQVSIPDEELEKMAQRLRREQAKLNPTAQKPISRKAQRKPPEVSE